MHVPSDRTYVPAYGTENISGKDNPCIKVLQIASAMTKTPLNHI